MMKQMCFSEAERSISAKGSEVCCGEGKVLLGSGLRRECWLFPQKSRLVCAI